MSVEFSDRIEAGLSEFYSLVLFRAVGMAPSLPLRANQLRPAVLSRSNWITITFYILTSFQRSRLVTLEAG